jgi:hypothetical protein
MTHFEVAALLASTTPPTIAALSWLWDRRRHKLQSQDEIIQKIHRVEHQRLGPFLLIDEVAPIREEQFWDTSGGTEGLRQRNENAGALVQLCQHLCESTDLCPSDIEEVMGHALLISLLTKYALVDEEMRIHLRALPRLHARMQATVYWQMAQTVRMICHDVDPELEIRLSFVL